MSAQDVHNTLVSWLNNAHAMERQLVTVLQSHIDDTRYPVHARVRFQEHLQETQTHAMRLEQAAEILGSSTSTIKDTVASAMGTVQVTSATVFDDALTRNTLIDYAAEQFEVAAYKALLIAARDVGQHEVASLLEMNLQEDQMMAAWLEQQLPMIVLETLHQEAHGR